MFFGQNFVFYKLLVDFCTLWTLKLGNHSKLNLKRWVIWNVILKDAGCSNGLIVNTQLTLHLCKLVLEFQVLSDGDDWQCYLIISLHSYLQICKGTKIVISILFAFECWPAFSYKSYQIRFVFLAKLNSPLILESSDYPLVTKQTFWSTSRHDSCLSLQLQWVTKTEFLPTISIQYQADKWWE